MRRKLLRRSRYLSEIRDFFTERDYGEAETPILSPFLIPEAALEVFSTRYLSPYGGDREMYLIPSPELWMKRLLAMGSGSIFQISRSFRNVESVTAMHNPEFTLLEWYTVGASYMDSIRVAEGLFSRLLSLSDTVDAGPLSPPFRRMSMNEAFLAYAGIDLAACGEAELLRSAALGRGIEVARGSRWDDAFHTVYVAAVEPALPRDRPIVLYDWPAAVPTTARRKPETPWAERWELFVRGIEVANCYSEETDPAEALRFLETESERKRGCRVLHAADEEYARSVVPSLPACSGAALGVDRLLMAFWNEPSIEGVIFFPFSDMLAH